MQSYGQRGLSALHAVSLVLWALRAPLAVSLLAFLVLSWPEPVLELYLVLARDWQSLWPQVVLAALTLGGLAVLLVRISRDRVAASGAALADGCASRSESVMAAALVLAIGLAPLAGVSLGLQSIPRGAVTPTLQLAATTLDALKSDASFAAAVKQIEAVLSMDTGADVPKPDAATMENVTATVQKLVPAAVLDISAGMDRLSHAIRAGTALVAALAALIVLAFGWQVWRSGWPHPEVDILHPSIRNLACLVCGTLIVLFAAQFLNAGRDFTIDFTAFPRALGTLAIVNLFLSLLAYFATFAVAVSERHRVPLLALMALVALAGSAGNWNDNHAIRVVATSAAPIGDKRLPDAADAFQAWMAARPAEYREKFQGQDYPVYVVAAQGGGMYAANLSGIFLARLYDRCPAIRHHLFAVSAVSGGSVGAGYLAALLEATSAASMPDTCDLAQSSSSPGPLESKMAELLRDDFLAPVAAGLLFPDFLQRFIPYPLKALDRAHAFEAGLEEAWDRRAGAAANPLRRAMSQNWRPDGNTPLLMLNVTMVETGRSAPITRVELTARKDPDAIAQRSFRAALGMADSYDVPLATAMSLSARLPVLLPAGSYSTRWQTRRVVDGGFYDNSGVVTAVELLGRIPSASGTQTYKHRLITLSDSGTLSAFYRNPPDGTDQGFDEALWPLRAMLNGRDERGRQTVAHIPALQGRRIERASIRLDHGFYRMPHGWQLSRETQDIIAAQLGDGARCGPVSQKLYDDAKSTLRWIDVGFELIAADRERRVPDLHFLLTPTTSLVNTLKQNHCAMPEALVADGIVP